MHKHSAFVPAAALLLALAGSHAAAQTPAANLMPDGSRDMYVGLGVVGQPRYEGAAERRVRALPLLQVQFSNGVFLSGMTAGMHLSSSPSVEFGPLLALQPRRTDDGVVSGVGGVDTSNVHGFGGPTLFPPPPLLSSPPPVAPPQRLYRWGDNRLHGMDPVRARVQAGGFLNIYLSPQWRLTNSVLAGAGGNGLVWNAGVQHLTGDFSAAHRLALTAGLELVNGGYNRTFFGVTPAETLRTGNPQYSPGGGLKNVYLGARWNWALSPSWMLSTTARVARLQGDARTSPLVERPNQITISTGLARRF